MRTDKLLVGVSTLALSLLLANAAVAADLGDSPSPVSAPMASTPYNWSGFYIGGQIGYASGDADHSFDNGAPSGDSSPDGIVGGGYIGYLYQYNRSKFVFGIEGDIEATGVDGTFQNATGGTSSGSTDINVQGSVRANIGYAIDRILPYITGGVAIADVDYGGGPVGGPCCGYSATAVGWTIGAGMQYAITDKVSGRIEYRYADFGTESGGLAPTFPGVTMPVDLKTNTIRAGVSIKLGGY